MNDDVVLVKVKTAHHQYPIYIGNALDYVSLLQEYLQENNKSVLHIICDKNIYQHHGEAFQKQLNQAKIRHHFHQLPLAGEAAKSMAVYQEMLNRLLENNIDRNHVIVAWGGGVVGDLAGFVAGTILRGVRFIQIPTTLLAQVDSSVGGKTGINMPAGKNLVGAFYQPDRVLIDCRFLQTLPKRELQAGYAEIVKYGLINDAPFFSWLQQSAQQIFALDVDALLYAITTSCRAKAAIVNQDEYETGMRALLNLGHSFGHGLERMAGYDNAVLLHGEAVAIGMGMAFDYATNIGKCDAGVSEIVKAHFTDLGMVMNPYEIDLQTTLNADNLLEAMGHDKKNYDESFTLILPEAIGKTFIAKGIKQQEIKRVLADILNLW